MRDEVRNLWLAVADMGLIGKYDVVDSQINEVIGPGLLLIVQEGRTRVRVLREGEPLALTGDAWGVICRIPLAKASEVYEAICERGYATPYGS